MVMFSTSPGERGGASVLKAAVTSAPYFDGDVKASLSLPSFYENFDQDHQRIINDQWYKKIEEAVLCLTITNI